MASSIVSLTEEDEALNTDITGAARLLGLLPVECLTLALVLNSRRSHISGALGSRHGLSGAVAAVTASGAVSHGAARCGTLRRVRASANADSLGAVAASASLGRARLLAIGLAVGLEAVVDRAVRGLARARVAGSAVGDRAVRSNAV